MSALKPDAYLCHQLKAHISLNRFYRFKDLM